MPKAPTKLEAAAARRLVVPPPPETAAPAELPAVAGAAVRDRGHRADVIQKVRSLLALRHRKQRDELSRLVRVASDASLPEEYIELLLAQIRSHDQAMEQLVGLDSGRPTLHLIGSNLVATMRSLGWLVPGRPELTVDRRGKRRAEMRYGLRRPLVVSGEWIINEDLRQPFEATVHDISETGVGLVASTCLPRDAQFRLPFALDATFQALASLIVIHSKQDENGHWRVGAAFTHLR